MAYLSDMSHLISMTLLFSVLCGTGAYIPHHYHFVNENKTWNEAQTYCREKYTDLATTNNMEEMNKLSDALTKEIAIQAWIGLNKTNTTKWQWSLASETFYKDGDSYTNWASGQPDNWMGNEFCVHMYTDFGLWNDNTCNSEFPFVCYDENNIHTNRYIFVNEAKTWFNAQKYCREKYTDLVSVRSLTENQEICNKINFTSPHVWIGLFKNDWMWSDKSNSSFNYWSYSQLNNMAPNEACAAVDMADTHHYWNDLNCNEHFQFICHENKLILIKQNLTWREALNYCREKYYDLVSVRTQEMQLWVKEVAQTASTEHVWLGLRYDCTQRIWFWVFGSMICYQDWVQGYGTWNKDCSQEKRSGAVQSRGVQQWIDLPESTQLNFICSTYDS